MNSNTLLSSILPKSFPTPIEGRDDFFSVDPKSFNIKQLNQYKKEIIRLINIEKTNLKKMTKYSNARIHAYQQGIILAEQTMQTNSMSVHSNLKPINTEGSISYIDPKTLTNTQLQLYIIGITEELNYEKQLLDELTKEVKSRIESYQNGLEHANHELNIRKRK